METHHDRRRILIADDHRLVAEACKNLLEPEFEVVALVYDGRELLKAEAELHPEVVILDISMPNLNGLDAGELIKQRNRAVKLIYLTMSQCGRTDHGRTPCLAWIFISFTADHERHCGIPSQVGCRLPGREANHQPPVRGLATPC